MLGAARDMDHAYSVVGRVVVGMDVLLALKQREPPANSDTMQSVHLLTDLPQGQHHGARQDRIVNRSGTRGSEQADLILARRKAGVLAAKSRHCRGRV